MTRKRKESFNKTQVLLLGYLLEDDYVALSGLKTIIGLKRLTPLYVEELKKLELIEHENRAIVLTTKGRKKAKYLTKKYGIKIRIKTNYAPARVWIP